MPGTAGLKYPDFVWKLCCPSLVSSAVVVRAFDFLPNIDRELAD